MSKSKIFSKRQAGYLLLEAALALSVAAGLATYYVRERADTLLENMAKTHGQRMALIADAANAYSVKYYFQIPPGVVGSSPAAVVLPVNPDQPGSATVTVANPLRPTVQNLSDLQLLPRGFTNTAMLGGTYEIVLQKGTGATSPVEGYVLITAPVQYKNQASAKLMGRALQAVGSFGGATGMPGDDEHIFSLLGGHNPNPSNPTSTPSQDITAHLNAAGIGIQAGIMGAVVGSNTANNMNLPYLRIDGTSTMRGPIQTGRNVIRFGNTNTMPGPCQVGDIVTSNGILHECRTAGEWTSIESTIMTLVDNKIRNLSIAIEDSPGTDAKTDGNDAYCNSSTLVRYVGQDGDGKETSVKCSKLTISGKP